MNGELTIGDLIPYLGMMVIVAGIIGQWAVNKHKVKELERRRVEDKEDLQDSISAVNISKSSKFKDVKDDFNEKIQITHKRIDKVRDDVAAGNKKTERQIDKLGEKLDQSTDKIYNLITELIKNK